MADTMSAADSVDEYVFEYAAVPFSRYAGNVAEAVRKSSVADKRDSIPSDPSVAVRSLRSASRSRADYAVGSIPMSSDVTASGARVYSIPIATAAGWNFAPSLGLCYSSQGGAGEAGHGWSVAGLSAITQRARSTYYDGVAGPVDIDATSAAYALDGVPLVTCSDQEMSDMGFTLETVTGNTFVKMECDIYGRARQFTVLSPDGSKALYRVPSGETADCTYPVVSITDAFGNSITFEYEADGGIQHIRNVRYGTDLSASVEFTYAASSVPRTGYVSGRDKASRRLLKSIVSLDGTDTVCRYSLYHENRYDTDLLKRVDCAREESHLPPIEFTYGMASAHSYEPMEDYNLHQYADDIMPAFFDNSQYSVLYSRGRMLCDANTMGMTSTLFFIPDTVIQKRLGRKKYGSTCSPGQKILVYPSMPLGALTHVDTTLTAGAGLQDVQSADIDGDGRDELREVHRLDFAHGADQLGQTFDAGKIHERTEMG